MLTVTTSWDDGHQLDLRTAALLERYGVRGTFYISEKYATPRLSEEEIRSLRPFHEVGAHTVTHPDLTMLPEAEALREMVEGKAWLEAVLGEEVPLFCYPSGRLNKRVVELAKEAGFRGARTTAFGATRPPEDPFFLGTTIQAYPFPLRKLDKDHYYWGKILQPLSERYSSLRSLGVPLSAMTSWGAAAAAAFEHALAHDGMFHLWGHSWEIERYGLWDDLEDLLKRMSEKKDRVRFVTNGELLGVLPLAASDEGAPAE
ncbi:MAG TPA: polysaccharide deacetylase family protein [Candidatus Paceibacterota bacterium]|nr:polysaccharide deacetylase family protein [Candidatus Paceibacterota bacterium]